MRKFLSILLILLFFPFLASIPVYAAEGSDSDSGSRDSNVESFNPESDNVGLGNEGNSGNNILNNEGKKEEPLSIQPLPSQASKEPIIPAVALFNTDIGIAQENTPQGPPSQNGSKKDNEKQIAKIEEKSPIEGVSKQPSENNPSSVSNLNSEEVIGSEVVDPEELMLGEINAPNILPKFSGYKTLYSESKIPAQANAFVMAVSIFSIFTGIYLINPRFFKPLLKKSKKEEITFPPVRVETS